MRRDWLIRINMKEWAVECRIDEEKSTLKVGASVDMQSTEVSMYE